MVGAAARAMAERAAEANPQELSNTVWSLARLHTPGADFCSAATLSLKPKVMLER